MAEEIEKELSLYKSSDFVPNHRKVYSQIYEAVFLDSPKITWHNLLKFIAQENGMYPKEFLKRFKRAKEIYLEAKKDLRDKKKARMNFGEVNEGGEPA